MYVAINRANLQVLATGKLSDLSAWIKLHRIPKQDVLLLPADENRSYSVFSTEELRELYFRLTGYRNEVEDYSALIMSVRGVIGLLDPIEPHQAPVIAPESPLNAPITRDRGQPLTEVGGQGRSPVIGENSAVYTGSLPGYKHVGNVDPSEVTQGARDPVHFEENDMSTQEQATEATPKDAANGVTRPKAGTKTGRVWVISDEQSKAEGKPAARKTVIEKAMAEGINAATAATQYGRWRKYHGLGAEVKEAAAGTSDVTTEGATE